MSVALAPVTEQALGDVWDVHFDALLTLDALARVTAPVHVGVAWAAATYRARPSACMRLWGICQAVALGSAISPEVESGDRDGRRPQ